MHQRLLQARLRKIAQRIAGERALYEEVSTLVQRTVFKVLRKAEQDRAAGRESVYSAALDDIPTRLLYKICANSANDLLRKKKRMPGPLGVHENKAPTPEALLLLEEDRRLLAQLLTALECYCAQPGLSEKQRTMRSRATTAFKLVRLQGRPTKEATATLGVHRSIIRTDIARVENFLRRQLEEME